MGRNRSRMVAAGLCVVLVLVAGAAYLYNNGSWWNLPSAGRDVSGYDERTDGYFTVVDENARTIFTTGHAVAVGDEFIGEDDTHYRVERVEGDMAYATTLGRLEALAPLPDYSALAQAASSSGAIGIYHTHSDESYIPTDGEASIPAKGGILSVGAAMAKKFEDLGLAVEHSTTPHDPHDAGAYDRSRRTATQLLKSRPLAIFDVHRDAGPAEPYLKDIDGREVAKAMIVIGRTNPKSSANLEFARRLKDEANKEFPGLVKGIFMGKADFNQDLSDRALLLEMGTEKVSREAAEAGVSLVASVVPNIVGGAAAPTGGTGKAIGWILGLAVGATFVYLWVATGSWEEMRAKILGWFGTGGVRIGGGSGEGDGQDGEG
jgi:stage II sporulation protein P